LNITWSDVTDIASELSTVATDTQNAILAQVALQLDEDEWAELYDVGCVYLAAHLATVIARRGSGGAVTSESAGVVSRSYAAASNSSQLSSTSYGVEYERLIGLLSCFLVIGE
jgi:hypothetical protein